MKLLNWMAKNWIIKNETLDELEAWMAVSQL